jgi:8-oxo-dGTP pyrophosphatase MutT (NUDIX family)
MVRRKDSMAYTEFLRGKYNLDQQDYIRKLLSNMTSQEQELISKTDFPTLWKNHWGEDCENQSKEYEVSLSKFSTLDFSVLLKDIEGFNESEWGFPKGRRAHRENDLECSVREFWEETNIPRDYYTICSNLTLKETFIGTNGTPYSHIYFITLLNKSIDLSKDFSEVQKREISAIGWKSVEECISCIRPYNLEKIQMITKIHACLTTNQFYFV